MDLSPENMSKSELVELLVSNENKYDKLQQSKDYLQYQYDELRRLLYGTKAERFVSENNPF